MRSSMRHAAHITGVIAALLLGCSTDTPESLLASGREYLSKNDHKAAVIQLKNALQKDPNAAEARFLLGKALLASGDVVSAEKELRKAQELKYSPEHVVPPLANCLVLLGQNKKVIDEFATVQLSTKESIAEVQTSLGQAQLALRNVNAARDAFTRALAAQPKFVPAHVGQARLVAGTGDLPQALAIVEGALKIAPAESDAWKLKGDIFLAQGQGEAAVAAYRRAVEANPGFLVAHSALVSQLIQQNKLEDAAKDLVAMKAVAPTHPQTLYLQALVAYQQKNLTAARQAIQEQLKRAPDYVPGLLLAGAIEFVLKSYAQSEAHLSKVLQRAPGNRMAQLILVKSYVGSGQVDKAVTALKPVLDKIDKDPAMLELAGEVYMMNGQPTVAAGYFAKAAALDPNDTGKRTTLALSHLVTGESDKSFSELERAAATDPGIRADLALIAAHMQRQEYGKALAAIAALEKKQPSSPLSHHLRGHALLAKKDATGARQSFERALEVNPTYFPTAAVLADLDIGDKKPDAARQRFESVLAKDPNNSQALLALALFRMKTGGTSDQIVGLLRKAVAAHSSEPAPRAALIGYYLGKKDTKKALAAAQEALGAMPDNAEILDAAGRAYQAAGETNQAVSIYGKLASVQPSSPYAYLRMAEVQVNAKKKDDALESLRKALAIKEDSLEALRGIIMLHVDSGRVREALAVAKTIQKQQPKQPLGYILEGDIHASRKNWSEASGAYRAGLAHVVSSELAIKLHNSLKAAGADSAAEQFAAGWLKKHPNDPALRIHLAQIATSGKDYRDAAQHYRKLLESHPNDSVILNNLAWVEAQLKDPLALEHAEKANTLAPNQPTIMDTLGQLLLEKGDVVRGLALLQDASRLAPQSTAIRLNLAKGLIKAGQKDAARKELDELAKLGDKFPGHSEVARLKRAL